MAPHASSASPETLKLLSSELGLPVIVLGASEVPCEMQSNPQFASRFGAEAAGPICSRHLC
ncbi:TniB family NTP-binding protein [Variovorax sp. HW608]|uniref:TniB family NTP-binding protein n=1 Tax=Variovorax sp. HW608 TaxID=1034889 RepID=UPI003FCE54B1